MAGIMLGSAHFIKEDEEQVRIRCMSHQVAYKIIIINISLMTFSKNAEHLNIRRNYTQHMTNIFI